MVAFPVCARGGRRLVAQALRPAVLIRKRIESATSWPRCVNSRNPASIVDGCVRRRVFSADFRMGKTKKNTFFQKRTGEVTENKGKGYMNSRKRTESEPEKASASPSW